MDYIKIELLIYRFIYFAKPLRYVSIMTPRRALAAIITVWLLVVLQASLAINWNAEIGVQLPCLWKNVLHKIAIATTLSQLWGITLCIIVPLYARIGCIARHLSKTEPHISCYAPENQAQQKKRLQERKMGMTLGLVLGVYLFCYTPQSLYAIVIRRLYEEPFPFSVLVGQEILNAIYKLQSVLNVFVYGWKNPTFRSAYLKMLGRKNHLGLAEIPLPVRIGERGNKGN